MSSKLFSLAMNELGDRYIEEAISYQASTKHYRTRSLLRMALVACLVLLLTFGTAMAASAELRETVVGWFREQYESFMHYEYRNEEENSTVGFVPHHLTEIPPGYTETDNICDKELGQQLIIYRNETEGRAFLVSAGIGGNAFVDVDGCTLRPVEVSGSTGELYLPNDPTRDSSIVWTKEDMFFCISGCFTPDELLHYAECFQPVETP